MITKFGIWGAVFGIGATLLVTGLVAAFAKGESSASWNLMWPYFAILWPARTVTMQDLEAVRPRFLGSILQVPPMVSALKHKGRRLYELAREGVVVEREAREVRIDVLEFTSVGPGPYPEVEFRVVCGKGTYVRSLADDIAATLGGAAHLTALRRTRIGSLDVDRHGIQADDLEGWEEKLISPEDALADLASIEVDAETARAVQHGVRFVGGELMSLPEGEPVKVLDESGGLLAVYTRAGDTCRAEVVLAN
jgi:tRNA pseudouridine55 synthase